jgi:hypothetical protein
MPNGQKQGVSRSVSIISAAILLGGVVFGLGLYSGYKRNVIFDLIYDVWKDVKLILREPQNLIPSNEPIDFLQPSRKPGAGVTVNERAEDEKLVLLAGFFNGGNELRLIRRDGSAVARWPLGFSRHFPDSSHLRERPATDLNVDLHGALINPDGSIVVNYEYSGMVKLTRCNQTVWALAHPTHHSIEAAETGGYWVAGRRFLSGADLKEFSPFNRMHTGNTFNDDLILRVTEDGAVARQMSVARILYDNGLEALMTSGEYSHFPGGIWDLELVHLNKIGELSSSIAHAFQGFEAGDLVISLRAQNLVLVIDPDDWRVKWHQTGPWLRQHDPEFNPDGTITVFNNNTYEFELLEGLLSNPVTPQVSNITKISPATGRTEVVYGGRKGEEFLSVLRGKHDPTPEGGFLITEHEAGRVFEVDAQGRIVWEYINRYDAQRVLELTEARLYPSSYFTVKDWSCPDTAARGTK